MKEVEEFVKWVFENKKIDLNLVFEEYTGNIEKNEFEEKETIYLNKILDYICLLFIVSKQDLILYNKKEGGKERGSNEAALARGMLVKYCLEYHKDEFDIRNVYQKLFGYKCDRTTAIYWKEYEPYGKYIHFWKSIVTFIESKNVIWETTN
jgi:hypothetical protein